MKEKTELKNEVKELTQMVGNQADSLKDRDEQITALEQDVKNARDACNEQADEYDELNKKYHDEVNELNDKLDAIKNAPPVSITEHLDSCIAYCQEHADTKSVEELMNIFGRSKTTICRWLEEKPKKKSKKN